MPEVSWRSVEAAGPGVLGPSMLRSHRVKCLGHSQFSQTALDQTQGRAQLSQTHRESGSTHRAKRRERGALALVTTWALSGFRAVLCAPSAARVRERSVTRARPSLLHSPGPHLVCSGSVHILTKYYDTKYLPEKFTCIVEIKVNVCFLNKH